MSLVIVGHRGVAAHFPENTRVSVQAAIDLGLNWVEVDVQPTKDNILVVCHDHTIDRCSNGQGRIDEMTLDELRSKDFGSWFDARFANEPIMTLAELLSLATKHALGLNIEVKVDRHDVAAVASQLKEQLDQCQLPKDKIMLSSFSHDIIRQLYAHCPGYKLGVLTERLTQSDRRVLKEVKAFSCNVNYKWLTQRHIADLHREGYQVWCYTVNKPEKFSLLNQVDGIFSDDPGRFFK